jgi:hypothetical protein
MKALIKIFDLTGLDTADPNAETASFDVSKANDIHFFVEVASGVANGFVLEVVGAGLKEDNTKTSYFLVSSSDISGVKSVRINACTYNDMKVRVKTVNAEACVVNVYTNTYWTLNP